MLFKFSRFTYYWLLLGSTQYSTPYYLLLWSSNILGNLSRGGAQLVRVMLSLSILILLGLRCNRSRSSVESVKSKPLIRTTVIPHSNTWATVEVKNMGWHTGTQHVDSKTTLCRSDGDRPVPCRHCGGRDENNNKLSSAEVIDTDTLEMERTAYWPCRITCRRTETQCDGECECDTTLVVTTTCIIASFTSPHTGCFLGSPLYISTQTLICQLFWSVCDRLAILSHERKWTQ